MRNFRDLSFWVLSKELSKEVYLATATFPKSEIFGITSQMRRASVSIPSNIAEGASRSSNKEFIYFLEIALGSAFELETQLEISNEIGFLDASQHRQLNDKLKNITNLMGRYRAIVKGD